MEILRTRGKTSFRKMSVRSYNVGSVYGEERTRRTKMQMDRHTHSRGRKIVVKTSKRLKKVEKLEKDHLKFLLGQSAE